MKLIVKLFMGLVLVPSMSALAQDTKAYLLSTGDVISINVFNEPELGLKQVKITDDGNVSVPLLGQVQIKDKTVQQVEALLTKRFGDDYLKKPSVTVSVDEYRPFYINGQVKKPGSYPFRTNMTVQIAVTIAGGFSERASKNNIFLLKEGNEAQKVKVALSDLVKPGDVITVDESFF